MEESIIRIIIDYDFFLKDHVLLSMKILNDFNVVDLNKYVINDKIEDTDFLIFLIQLFSGHARGIQSTLIKGSKISTLYLPSLSSDKLLHKIKTAL